MRCKSLLTLFVLLVIILINACSTRSVDGLLFDGRSFLGWEGNKKMFRIEGGSIVAGKLDKEVPRNEFLCTEITYENFELTLKAKLKGDDLPNILNAGIQFRSERIPNSHEVIGYQCDMGSDFDGKIWGYLYDESRRNKFLAQPENSEMLKVLKSNDWNEFVIRAEGKRIQIWLNGFQTVDYIEDDQTITSTGVICLQIHGGFKAEAWYKDIEINEL